MASARKIKREDEVAEKADVEKDNKEVAEVVAPAKPVEKPKSLDVTAFMTGGVGVMSIRKIGSYVLFNDGLKNVRMPIDKSKPVIVTLRQ